MPAGFEPAMSGRTDRRPRLKPRGIVPRENNKKNFQSPESRKSHALKCHHQFIQSQFHFTSLKHNVFRAEFDIARAGQAVDIVHTPHNGRPRSGGPMGCKDKIF